VIDKATSCSNRSLLEKNFEVSYEILYFLLLSEKQNKQFSDISAKFNNLLLNFHNKSVKLAKQLKSKLTKDRLDSDQISFRFLNFVEKSNLSVSDSKSSVELIEDTLNQKSSKPESTEVFTSLQTEVFNHYKNRTLTSDKLPDKLPSGLKNRKLKNKQRYIEFIKKKKSHN
jgi:hypothetical protein